jgi:hypothetical protein
MRTLNLYWKIIPHTYARFEVFTTVKIQVEVFCVVTLSTVVLGYHCFGVQCCLHLPGEGSMDLRNGGILPNHYMTSQPRRLRLESLIHMFSWYEYSIYDAGNKYKHVFGLERKKIRSSLSPNVRRLEMFRKCTPGR